MTDKMEEILHEHIWLTCQEAKNAAKALRAAGYALEPTQSVRVKPLEWEQGQLYEHVWTAITHIGDNYQCSRLPSGLLWEARRGLRFPSIREGTRLSTHKTLEEAQSVCHADYERRILSALEPVPDDLVKAAEDAAKWFEDKVMNYKLLPNSGLNVQVHQTQADLLRQALSNTPKADHVTVIEGPGRLKPFAVQYDQRGQRLTVWVDDVKHYLNIGSWDILNEAADFIDRAYNAPTPPEVPST